MSSVFKFTRFQEFELISETPNTYFQRRFSLEARVSKFNHSSNEEINWSSASEKIELDCLFNQKYIIFCNQESIEGEVQEYFLEGPGVPVKCRQKRT